MPFRSRARALSLPPPTLSPLPPLHTFSAPDRSTLNVMMIVGVLGSSFGSGTDSPRGAAAEQVQSMMAEAALPGQPAASTAEEQVSMRVRYAARALVPRPPCLSACICAHPLPRAPTASACRHRTWRASTLLPLRHTWGQIERQGVRRGVVTGSTVRTREYAVSIFCDVSVKVWA